MAINYNWILFIGLICLNLSGYAQDTKSVHKDPPLTQFEDKQPVFKLKGEQLENKYRHLHFYALTGYREGLKPIVAQFNMNFAAQKDSVNGTHRIKMYNLSIIEMLTNGLTKSEEVILEVKDPSRYRYDPKYGSHENWIRKNTYCYEILLPENTLKNMYQVIDHISHLFKVKCGYQTRLVKTSVVKNGITEEKNVEKEVFVITEIK